MSSEDDSDKEHAPTQKRLDDARRRGDLLRSAELDTATGQAALLAVLFGYGSAGLQHFGDLGMVLLGQADQLAASLLHDGGATFAGIARAVALAVLPLLLAPMLAILLVQLLLGGFVLSGERLTPSLSKISPLAALGQKFGRKGLFDFGRSSLKMLFVATVLILFLQGRLPRLLVTAGADPMLTAALLGRSLLDFLVVVLIMAAIFGGADLLFQRLERLRRLQMSRQEIIDEFRDSEGDPHVKGQRRQRGREIAMNRMMADVPKADVVIANPTHYAVALRWKRGSGQAPVCVAKGVDAVALAIRARAAEAGVPVHVDPPTARALHATVAIGREIHPDHYKAVAAAIRFAQDMRRRARARWGG